MFYLIAITAEFNVVNFTPFVSDLKLSINVGSPVIDIKSQNRNVNHDI